MDLEKGTFISSVFGGPMEEYYLGKNSWSAVASDWKQRFEVGDAITDPAGDWDPSSAETYIDQQIATVTGDLAAEVIARQTGDTNLQSQVNDIKKNKIYLTGTTLTQSMINQANTIYVVKDNFILAENIIIPLDCVLEFEGGSLNAGNGSNMNTVTGNNTGIDADLTKILNTNLVIEGTWDNELFYSDWFGAKGDGITDDTSIIQYLVNFSKKTQRKIKFNIGNYVISDTIVFDNTSETQAWISLPGFKFSGDSEDKTIFSVKISNNNPAFYFKSYNNGTRSFSTVIEDLSIQPFNSNYNRKFDGIVLENSMGYRFNTVSVTGARYGIKLTSKGDTQSFSMNSGYTEFNCFNNCSVGDVDYGISFCGEDVGTSFHGNAFYNCFCSVGGNQNDPNAIAINLERGYLYNCVFNISSFIGSNATLLYIGTTGLQNFGSIRYEVTKDYAKIKTSNYGGAFLNLKGEIIGLGDLNYDDYHPVSIGDILTYESDGITPATYVTADSSGIGRDRLFVDNLYPKAIFNEKGIYGSTLMLIPDKNDMSSIWENSEVGFYRYSTYAGSTERGLIIAGQTDQVPSRLILGQIPKNGGIRDFQRGFSFYLSGSNFTSHNSAGDTDVVFEKDSIKVNNKKIHTNNSDWTLPSENMQVGDIFYYLMLNEPVFYGPNGWRTYDNFNTGIRRVGTTVQRPNSSILNNGFTYLDITLGKPIWWLVNDTYPNGTWIDSTGTVVS